MIRATAILVTWDGVTGVGYRILACPEAPEYEGGVFAAPREMRWRVGQQVSVTFHPDDQYAHEVT